MRFISILIFIASFHQIAIGQTLLPYACFSDQFTADGWMKQYQRKLDSNGIVTQKKQYHPLSIAAYGIMSYDEYHRTGDKRHLQNALNQFKYFKDTNFVHTSNNNTEIGLPYHFNFNDLKAPWYSGMTQGMAISYLLRYYDLTHDKLALDIVVKLKNFMVKLVEDGGTVGCTSEGYLFIEEYPNSKRSKQVLNGNINGLIGLYEYLQFYPDDEEAWKIYHDNYTAIEQSFEFYDKVEWTSYNRNKKNISNQYIRYQLAELDHLNSFNMNEQFQRQMMLWGFYSYNKFDKNLKFYKTTKYNFSIPLRDTIINGYSLDYTENEIKQLDVKIKRKKDLLDQLIVNKKRLHLQGTDSYTKVVLQRKGIKEKHLKKVDLPSNKYTISTKDNALQIDIKDTTIVELDLHLKKSWGRNKATTVSLSKQNRHSAPMFAYKKLGTYKLEENVHYSLQLESINTEDLTIFYRIAKDAAGLKKTKWKEYQHLNTGEYQFSESGVIDLLLSFRITGGYSQVSNFQFKQSTN